MTKYRFDQIAENIRVPVMPKPKDSERYIGLEHLDTDSLRIRRWGTEVNLIGQKLEMKKGDVLFAKRNAYIRRVAVAPFEGLFSAHGMVLRAKTDVCLHEFLPVFMQSDYFMERAIKISVGSLSPTINWSALAHEEFELPSLEEQQRIANMLWAADNHLFEINSLLEGLLRIRKSYIVEKFTQILKGNSKIVPMTQAGDVLMGRQRSPQYEKGISPRPYLRVANVYDGYVDTTDVKTMDFSDKEYKIFGLKYGDVLLVEGHSSAEVVGRSLIYKDEVPGSCFQNTLIRFRTKSVSPEFAHQYFRHCLYTREFSRVAKQTTIAHLGSTRFAKMKFPLVAKEIDHEVTKTISEIESSIAQTQQQITVNKNLKSQMFSSMLGNNVGD